MKTSATINTVLTRIFESTLVLFLLLGLAGNASAHAKQESYVWLNVEEDAIVGRFENRD